MLIVINDVWCYRERERERERGGERDFGSMTGNMEQKVDPYVQACEG
jgi:hypothetical protein